MFCFFFSLLFISIILFLKGRKSQFWFCLFLNVKFCLLSSFVESLIFMIVFMIIVIVIVIVIIIIIYACYYLKRVSTCCETRFVLFRFVFFQIFLTSQSRIDACFGEGVILSFSLSLPVSNAPPPTSPPFLSSLPLILRSLRENEPTTKSCLALAFRFPFFKNAKRKSSSYCCFRSSFFVVSLFFIIPLMLSQPNCLIQSFYLCFFGIHFPHFFLFAEKVLLFFLV